ncbi:MAG: hypothetical protein K1X79_04890 [Oligoflexia bacterium]|nr:hypothetical protein [Oligoflexia bacterium]
MKLLSSKLAVPLLSAVGLTAIAAAAFLWYRSTQTIRHTSISTSRFGEVAVLLPPEEPQGFALYLAAQTSTMPEMAQSLAQLGFAVGVVDSPAYLETVNREAQDDCLLFSGELTRLAQVIQKNSPVPHLFPALLAGDGPGASIAMSALAQSPRDFKGALLLNFCPRLSTLQKLCEEGGFSSAAGQPFNLHPPQNLSKAVLVWNEPGLDCDRGAWEAFVAPLTKKSVKERPFAGAELARFIRGADFLERRQDVGSIAELPVIDLLPETQDSDDLVVFLSGDGGWATIDKEIGESLRHQGVAVIGFDTLRYFWKHKSAQQSALDLERVIMHYSASKHYKHISLIGFSFGADILPALVNLLDEETRNSLHRIILLNPGLRYDFEVNLTDWLNIAPSYGSSLISEQLKRVPPQKLICMYTSDESEESVCASLAVTEGRAIEFKGDHHFDGDYKRIAKDILGLLHNPVD